MDYNTYRGRGKDKISGADRPISYLPNISEWIGKIYCLEDETDQYTADEVLGGVSGIDNAQAQALANRTYYLKDYVVQLAQIVSAMQLALQPMLTTIKKLTIQRTELEDYTHAVWLYLGNSPQAQAVYTIAGQAVPRIVVTFKNGTAVELPICEISLRTGQTFVIRTDGKTVIVPVVEDFLDIEED